MKMVMNTQDTQDTRDKKRDLHIRTYPDAATAKPVWCGETNVASITEAWGYYGPGGAGHAEVCRGCIDKQKRARKF